MIGPIITVDANQFNELVRKAAKFDAERYATLPDDQKREMFVKCRMRVQHQRHEIGLLTRLVAGGLRLPKPASKPPQCLKPEDVKKGDTLIDGFGTEWLVATIGPTGFMSTPTKEKIWWRNTDGWVIKEPSGDRLL